MKIMCPHCGSPNSDADAACYDCGKPLAAPASEPKEEAKPVKRKKADGKQNSQDD